MFLKIITFDGQDPIDNLKLDKKTVQDLTDYAFSLFYQLGRLHMTNELSNRVQTQPQKTLKSNTNPSIANQNLQSLLTQYAKGCSGLKKTGFCLLGIIVFGSLLYSGVSLYAFGKQKYFDWKRKNTTD